MGNREPHQSRQVIVDEKSDEITAIQKLLQSIDVSGALVTIDAMGCQTEIAAKVIDQGADYCLAVKGNQPTLHARIKAYFSNHLEDDFARIDRAEHHTKKTTHGRIDERSYYFCEAPTELPDKSRWKGLVAIGMSINNAARRRGDENFGTQRRTALSLLKKVNSAKCGIKNKRLTAGWDDNSLEKVVFSR